MFVKQEIGGRHIKAVNKRKEDSYVKKYMDMDFNEFV